MVKRQAGGSWDTAKPMSEDEGWGWPRWPSPKRGTYSWTAGPARKRLRADGTAGGAGYEGQRRPGRDQGGEALEGGGRSADAGRNDAGLSRGVKASRSLQALQSGPVRFRHGLGSETGDGGCGDTPLLLRLRSRTEHPIKDEAPVSGSC